MYKSNCCIYCGSNYQMDKSLRNKPIPGNAFCLSCVFRMSLNQVKQNLHQGIVTQDQYDYYYEEWIRKQSRRAR